jgi:preprotein translocase subunit SecE
MPDRPRRKLLPKLVWVFLFVLGAAGAVWLVDAIIAAFP